MRASNGTDYSCAINPPRRYRVVSDSFSGASRFCQLCQLNIFTDGSRLHDRTGTGYVIYEGANEYDTGSFSLSPSSMVFQAELVAILLSVRHVLCARDLSRSSVTQDLPLPLLMPAVLCAGRSGTLSTPSTLSRTSAIRSALSGCPPTPVSGATNGRTPWLNWEQRLMPLSLRTFHCPPFPTRVG